jgi:hypothetical protein
MPLNFVDDCNECKRFSANYEAVTMQWFRVQGELRIAAWSRDQIASDRIVAELTRIGRRREQLREAAETHIDAAHPRVASACSSFF